jgi:uncharacterized protein
MAHEICYIELIATDIKRAGAFYAQVFGWQTTPMGENYMTFKPGDGPEGGFSPPMTGIERGACVYVQTDDIDGMLEKIVASGGEKITGKTKISDEYGYYGLFKDPHGNVLGLWSKI